MTEKDFKRSSFEHLPKSGNCTWKSPSNIALVKYWGKKENQIPANPSVSFTLDACATTTTLEYTLLDEDKDEFSFDLFFEGKPKISFKPKINKFFERIEEYCPYIRKYHFKIETSNSFPHSSGIASSASGMSALALCLMSLEKEIVPEMTQNYFNQKASFLARLGSGSACRSIEGNLIVWGNHKDTIGSSDLLGVRYPYEVHSVFDKFHDTILLVDKGKKQVSSTLGHQLMNGHPFAENRFKQAHQNLLKLQKIFKEGDLKSFIEIVESEALTLHAMMMTSLPYFILMQPNTLQIIHKIWAFREKTNSNVCFTLDAGANVHVLYPESEKELVFEFIKNELVAYCENGHYICDRIGFGAKQLAVDI
ncbi:diphosphomevalonate decarboxylase [Flavobacteriaceae bacterium R38]|nr:diphosphomevalonate decarboxylase [Flavobacteriaceae bacterium R38]